MTTAFVSRTECRPDHGTSRAATMKSLARKIPDWINDPQSYQAEGPKKSYRTVFISDVHLGTSGCSAAQLVDFLHSFECETLYLVGDIVDGWQIRRGWYWPSSHNDVIRSILKFARRGTRVIYIPGNHDEAFRDYVGLEFGGVEMVEEDIHETADGRRLLVLHGDKFDGVVLYAKWLAFLGDHAYTALLKANSVWNFARRKLGLPYWSLSAYAKHRVKNAVNFIGRFEETVAHAAAEHGVDGVVCGHIHTAEIRRIGDIMYYNDGDWVESCTALVEDHAGAMSLIDWRAETWEKELARANGGIAAGAAAAEAGRAVATA